MKYQLVHKNGRPVKKGDILTSFRGEKWRAMHWDDGPTPGKSGKIHVGLVALDETWQQCFYISVFNLKWKEIK